MLAEVKGEKLVGGWVVGAFLPPVLNRVKNSVFMLKQISVKTVPSSTGHQTMLLILQIKL